MEPDSFSTLSTPEWNSCDKYYQVLLSMAFLRKLNIPGLHTVMRITMTIDNELSRIGISLPKHLLDRFDEIINYRGYSSRSEGIRDAIRNYIQHYKWMADVKGERQGVITIIYDHDQRAC